MTAATRAWNRERAAASDWTPPSVHTLIVAPHPDDEILLFGGLIAHQLDAGSTVVVLTVTDGEAAYPGREPQLLAEIRRREQHEALRVLGGTDLRVVRLGVPDGAVASFSTTISDAIGELSEPDGLVAAPWHLDHHTDHEAVGRAALVACRRAEVQLVQGLFWSWWHRHPDELGRPLRRLPLPPTTVERRRRALACHRSQLDADDATPVLDITALEPLDWAYEYHLADRSDVD